MGGIILGFVFVNMAIGMREIPEAHIASIFMWIIGGIIFIVGCIEEIDVIDKKKNAD